MMKHLTLLVALALLPANGFAAKRLSNKYPSYFPVFGLGSTSSVAYTGAAGKSFSMLASDGAATNVVRVLTTTAAYIAVGSDPTATASDMLVPANTEIYLEILSGYKVSAVPLSSSGTLYVTNMVTYPNND